MGLVVRSCHFDVTACAEARRLDNGKTSTTLFVHQQKSSDNILLHMVFSTALPISSIQFQQTFEQYNDSLNSWQVFYMSLTSTAGCLSALTGALAYTQQLQLA